MKNRIFACVFSVAAFFSLSAQSIHPDFRDGMLYVKFVNEFPLNKISSNQNNKTEEITENGSITKIPLDQFPFLEKVFKKYGVIAIHRPFTIYENPKLLRILQIEFSKIAYVDVFIKELKSFPEIEYAEKIPVDRLCWTPNDPLYGNVSGGNMKWHLDMIKADSAWNVQKGSPNIKVAVVDNFIWGNHPDLQIDSVNLCKISYDSYAGYTYTLGNSATMPPSSTYTQSSNSNAYEASHGTHCSGLVGAKNDNNIGIASIGGGVTLMGVRSAIDNGSLYYTYQGVQWAAEHGADVISMSFGSSQYSQTIETLMQTLFDAGIVLVAAAGNDGDNGNPIHYPSEYPSVISVASIDGDKKLSYFSQYGDRAEIAAPGGFIKYATTYPNILSTTYCKTYLLKNSYTSLQNSFYDGMQGTSMACPVAAGLCGLMLSQDSTLSPTEIRYRLHVTALPLDPASSTTINGNGYINAYAALTFKELTLKDTLYLSGAINSYDTINIKSTDDWTITNIPSWLTFSDTNGLKGITTINITVNSANTSGTNREAVVSIEMNGITKHLRIIQLNYELYLSNTPHYIRFSGAKGKSDTIIISSNTQWEIINQATWLGLTKTSGYGNDTLIVSTKSSNSWGYNRFCTLYIHSINFIHDTVIIEQKIPDFIKWQLTSTQIGPANGDTVSVELLSNVNWTLSGGATWINADISSGIDSLTIIFTVLEDNTTGAEKNTSFIVSNGTISKTLYITQNYDLGINNLASEEKINIYPNPVSENFTIQTKGIVVNNVKIYDVMGSLITSNFPLNNGIINIESLSKGIYIVAITTDKQSIIYQKVIKQ